MTLVVTLPTEQLVTVLEHELMVYVIVVVNVEVWKGGRVIAAWFEELGVISDEVLTEVTWVEVDAFPQALLPRLLVVPVKALINVTETSGELEEVLVACTAVVSDGEVVSLVVGRMIIVDLSARAPEEKSEEVGTMLIELPWREASLVGTVLLGVELMASEVDIVVPSETELLVSGLLALLVVPGVLVSKSLMTELLASVLNMSSLEVLVVDVTIEVVVSDALLDVVMVDGPVTKLVVSPVVTSGVTGSSRFTEVPETMEVTEVFVV